MSKKEIVVDGVTYVEKEVEDPKPWYQTEGVEYYNCSSGCWRDDFSSEENVLIYERNEVLYNYAHVKTKYGSYYLVRKKK